MNRSIAIYALLLVVGSAASYHRYTDDSGPEKEGVILIDGKKDDLSRIVYNSPDADVTYETREDGAGKYGWVTVVDHKHKKPAKEGDPEPPVETKTTVFKAGTAADKVVETFAPLAAMREIAAVDDAKLTSFGLKAPDTSVTVTVGNRTTTIDLGGETYGTKDRYARDRGTNKLYIIDDEAFKPLKFAGTRLPERNVFTPKAEDVETIALGAGATTVRWTHKNKDDTAAAFWERDGTEAGKKDETFSNWFDKAFKIKSSNYVQPEDKPTDLVPVFDLTITASGKPSETLRIQKSGEDYYAQSEFTRGLVKLTKGPTEDAAGEVQDILEGRTPAPKEKKPPAPPPHGMPPRPGMPPMPGGMPGMAIPPRPGAPAGGPG